MAYSSRSSIAHVLSNSSALLVFIFKSMVFLHLSAFFMILSLRFIFSGVWGWSSKKLQCFRRECLKVSSLELINGVEFRTLSSVMMARLYAPRNIRGGKLAQCTGKSVSSFAIFTLSLTSACLSIKS